MISTDVLVLGAGLAGLSTAYHLEKARKGIRCLVVEKTSGVGGRAGSVRKDGFTFDHTGHLLHLHDPYGKKLILDLLDGNFASHERSAWIYSHRAYTRYPFQANTYGLPPSVAAECVAGLLKNAHRPPIHREGASFERWCLDTFGKGICRHFMFPYNRKLWRMPLSRMTTEWQGRFFPEPSPVEALYGALTDQKKFFGYNAHFLYPIRGGIQSLPNALALRVADIRLNCPALWVDLAAKTAGIEGVGEVRFERLVNTLPLPEFLDLVRELPEPVRAARRRLRHVSVYNLNLGVRRAPISDKHWVYFPDKKFPFYRVGFSSNFSRHVAPPKTTALYVEVSGDPGREINRGALERRCIEGLRACGILRPSDPIETRLWIDIPCAYVIYDRDRTPALAAIYRHLRSRGADSIGRWGGWKYSFMEETILDGRACADRILGRKTRVGADAGTGKLVAMK